MSRRLAILLLLGLCAATAAQADTYRVDLIVFLDLYGPGGEAGSADRTPDLQGALDVNDAAGLRAAGIQLLPDEQFGLADEWRRLRYSRQFRPLARLAWTQNDPPAERGPALRIRPSGKTVAEAAATDGVDGTIALLMGRYLHLDADLLYTQDGLSWRLDERRKLRRDEVHHLDSPRLGILARVTKADGSP